MNFRKAGNIALITAGLVFSIFSINVLLAGPLRQAPWLSDINEMLLLFLFVIFFVVGVLCREQENNVKQ